MYIIYIIIILYDIIIIMYIIIIIYNLYNHNVYFYTVSCHDDDSCSAYLRGRGWCRAEMWCKLLSEKSDFPIIAAWRSIQGPARGDLWKAEPWWDKGKPSTLRIGVCEVRANVGPAGLSGSKDGRRARVPKFGGLFSSCRWTHGIADHFSIWKVIMRWILIKTRTSQHSR